VVFKLTILINKYLEIILYKAYFIILAFLSFIGSKEFNGLNWIHYPYDFIVIAVVALVFYKLGTTSYFEGIYFKRAKKINKKMKENLPDESQE